MENIDFLSSEVRKELPCMHVSTFQLRQKTTPKGGKSALASSCSHPEIDFLCYQIFPAQTSRNINFHVNSNCLEVNYMKTYAIFGSLAIAILRCNLCSQAISFQLQFIFSPGGIIRVAGEFGGDGGAPGLNLKKQNMHFFLIIFKIRRKKP